MSDSEIFSRVVRRRRWSPAEKAALLAEVAAEGGQVRLVARRHRISPSLLYNWRAVWASATTLVPATPAHFIPLGRISEANPAAPVPPVPRPRPASKGGIEITLTAEQSLIARQAERVQLRDILADEGNGSRLNLIDTQQSLLETHAQMQGDIGGKTTPKDYRTA